MYQVHAYDALIDIAKPGDRVEITGVYASLSSLLCSLSSFLVFLSRVQITAVHLACLCYVPSFLSFLRPFCLSFVFALRVCTYFVLVTASSRQTYCDLFRAHVCALVCVKSRSTQRQDTILAFLL